MIAYLPTDSSKIADKMKFSLYNDNKNQWLAVPNYLIRELALVGEISKLSKMQGAHTFLHSRTDGYKFFNKFTQAFGCEPKINEVSRGSLIISKFKSFKMDL